ncbi:MAG TPA: type II secretion system minor pseudopilin GspJ [Allosphingosinicella sp.]|nr:type II secretion system minor pseudopilin GspJ [Allosphingosinicella sp.]
MRRGFTLVEMLIALTIFGMLTAAGVALLTLTVRTQQTSERLLGEVGALRRLGALMTADLGQAAARPSRDRDGRPRPAFAGAALTLALVRRGGEEGALQRVEYRLDGDRLERLAYDRVDGESRAVAMPLLDDVRQLRLRYRDREGAWRDAWDPSDANLLPRAVELVSRDDAHGTVRQLFLVGGGR